MREILFRGKRKDNGEWVYGYLYITHKGEYEIGAYNKKFGIERVTHIVIPETVGQFTGNDKNGEKIFEDDILQFDYTGKNLGVAGVAAVVFENGKFGVKWGNYKEFVCLDGFANTTLEVIGNIYDNPELIED